MLKIQKLLYFTVIVAGVTLLTADRKVVGAENEEEETAVDEWLYAQKAFPYGVADKHAQRNAIAHMQSAKAHNALFKTTADGDDWSFIGPYNIGGRILDVDCPGGNKDIIYVATASGGVLKTYNGGDTWQNIFDTESTLSIGDIAIDPVDTATIYIGTGEPGNGVGSVTYDGNGIYKSTNSGATWTNIGLSEGGNTGRIAINPDNTQIIFAAMLGDLFQNTPDRGIYRTENGGTTWEKVLYVNDSTGGIDVAINPENPNIIYASTWERVRRYNRRDYAGVGSRIYRSEDGGDTWEMLSTGLPFGSTELSRIMLSIAPSDPDIVYASIVASNDKLKDIYKSTNGGDTWTPLNCAPELETTSQDNWFGGVKVDPNNANHVYWIGFICSRSLDGGNNWELIMEDAHVDCHAMYLHPTDNNFRIMGSDGGLFFTYDDFDDYTMDQNIPVTQLYTLDVFPSDTSLIIGGAQDNGSFIRDPSNYWAFANWGDGVSTKFVPVDDNSYYANYQYGGYFGYVDGDVMDLAGLGLGSDRFNWRSPLELNPLNPKTIYFGGSKIYRSNNYGNTMTTISSDLSNGSQGTGLTFGTVFTIHNAPADTNYIYVGTDDANVWKSDDYGATWDKITDGLPYRYCMSIETDPEDAETVYVAFSGFRWAESIAHVYKSTDAGETWTPIDGDMPDIPVNDIQIFKTNDTTGIVLATDVGVYYSYNDGVNWNALGTTMPIVSVYEINYNEGTNYLFAGTYGRGAWKMAMPRKTQNPIAITTLNIADYGMFPNPTSDQLWITLNATHQNVQTTVMALDGKVVKQQLFRSTNQPQISMRDLAPGTYLVKVQVGEQFVVKKVIKS